MSKVYLYTFKISRSLKAPEVLNDQELLRYEKMGSEKRKLEFLNSRYLIKSVLNLHGIKSSIKESQSGKPFVKGIKFNVSHSGDKIVIAVSKNELGVDIELSEGKKHFREISEKYFSELESKYIFSTKSPLEQMKRFKMLWSLKESYIKTFNGVLNKRSMKIYFDLAKNNTENIPTKKSVSFAYNKQLNIALCVVGKIKKNDLKVISLSKSLKLNKSNLQFVFLK